MGRMVEEPRCHVLSLRVSEKTVEQLATVMSRRKLSKTEVMVAALTMYLSASLAPAPPTAVREDQKS